MAAQRVFCPNDSSSSWDLSNMEEETKRQLILVVYKVASVIVGILIGLALGLSAFAIINALCFVIERNNRKDE
jgi:predicted outer membrane lipoprotein